MALNKRHRLLNPDDGIHVAHAWDVSSLDDISVAAGDAGKFARVQPPMEGEGETPPPVELWWLRYVDASLPESLVPYWLRIATFDDLAAIAPHWVTWQLATLEDLDLLEVQLEDQDGVARVDGGGEPSYWVLSKTYEAGEGELATVGKEWSRLDNVDGTVAVSTPAEEVAPYTPLTVDVYVSAAAGSDANDGSIGSPKATLAGAWALLPALQSSPFIVHMASGAYAYTAPPGNVQLNREAHVTIYGDGAGQPGDDGFSLVATGTLTTGSNTTSLKPSAALTVDQYACMMLEMTSGATVGRRRTVTRNTTTTVELANALNASPGSGDAYRVVRPGVVFTGVADVTAAVELANGRRVLKLVNVALSGTPNNWYAGEGSRIEVWGVELRNSARLLVRPRAVVHGGSNMATQEAGTSTPLALGAVAVSYWDGWGLSGLTVGSDSLATLGDHTYFQGYICTLGTLQLPPTFVYVRGGRCASLLVEQGRFFKTGNSPFWVIPDSATFPGVEVRGHLLAAGLTIEQAQANYAMTVMRGGRYAVGGPLLITSSAAFEGLRIGAGAEVSVYSNEVNITCTAAAALLITGGEFRTDNGILKATGNAAGSGAVVVESGGSLLLCGPSGQATINNTSTAANSDGMRLRGLGKAYFHAYPNAVASVGSSGFGVNARGGGQFSYAHPGVLTSVVGPTADFSVGSGVGENFPDTDLSTVYAFKQSGLSVVQRVA